MTTDVITETRAVGDFHAVSLRAQHNNELIIDQGDRASLQITAPQDILSRIETKTTDGRLLITLGGSWQDRMGDALTTSLTRPRIAYHLTVTTLTELELLAFVRAEASRIDSDRLAIRFSGVGEVRIAELHAQSIDVELQGAGGISLAGRVAEQNVTMSGPGEYQAADLQSQRARLTLNGVGQATVWASESLDVAIRGIGSVSYYGAPRVTSHLTPMGRLVPLGNR